MKKLFMFIAAVLALVSCSSVTSNKEDIMVQEDRKVGKFTSIAIQGSPTVIYRQGITCTVKVRANKSVIKDIKTTIDNGCLNVSMKGKGGFFVFSKEKPITIYVTSPDLIGVEIAGSGDFKSEMPLDTDNIRLVVRGSGDIDFDGKILCDNAKMEVTGSGDIDVKDIEALTTDISVIGSGEIDVNQQKVINTDVRLTGSGDITIKCESCGNINSNLTGSGDISIYGSVNNISKQKAGSGDYNINVTKK